MNNITKNIPTPSELHQQVLSLMNKFAKDKGVEFISDLVYQYASSTRLFSYPEFHELDRNDMSQRREDMIGGLLYTNSKFPWPIMPSNGLYMQPIFQMNLENASSILSVDLGNGILQGWGPVAPNIHDLSVNSRDFIIRHIAQDDLSNAITPESPDWKVLKDGKSIIYHHMEISDNHPAFGKPRIKWGVPLKMFGSRQQFIETARRNFENELEDFGDDEFMDLADEFMDAISCSPLIGGYGANYMGGFGGQTAGESDPSYGENLLLRVCDREGFFFAVHWAREGNGGVRFKANFTLRP